MNFEKPSKTETAFSSWNLIFGIYCFSSFSIALWLFSLPPDPKYAFLFGFSVYRISIGLLLILIGAASLIGISKNRRETPFHLRLERLVSSEKQVRLFLSGTFFLILFNWILLVVLSSAPHGELLGIRSRLLPIIIWIFVTGFSSILWLLHKKSSFNLQILKDQKRLLILCGLVFASAMGIWLLFALTGIGIEPDPFGWGRRMVPLLSWQVGFAWVFALILVPMTAWQVFPSGFKAILNKNILGIPIIDLLVVVGLWILAMTLWYVPIPGINGYPPDSVTNPDRDSALYEISVQSLLNGYGFNGHELVPRPMYLFGLAVIHLFSGNSYVQIVFYQTMVIAFLPGIIYLLATKMGNRIVGILVGLLAILREFNSILSTGFGIVSNSRMIMSDVPATLAICLVTLICVIWLMKENQRLFRAICCGGLLACAILVRTQIIILVPVVILVSFFVYRKKGPVKFWVRDVVGFMTVLLLVISPWMIRNKLTVGEFVMDDPLTQTSMIAQRYVDNEKGNIFTLASGESKAAFSTRLTNSITSFILKNPQKVLVFTVSHFARNLMDTVLVLPYQYDFIDYHDNAVVQTAFWHPHILDLGTGGILLVGLNLLFFSIGLVYSIQKIGLAGIIPLSFNLAYNFSNAVARNSGYRFMLPVDWVSYLYYGIGLVVAIHWLLSTIGLLKISSKVLETGSDEHLNQLIDRKRYPAIALAAFFLIGLALPLSEVLIPQKYPLIVKEELINNLAVQYRSDFTEIELQDMQQFINQPESITARGLLLVPGFVPGNTSRSGIPPVKAVDYSQFVFMFIQPKPVGVSLPYENTDIKFPDFSDAIVIGCKRESLIEAKVLILENTGQVFKGYGSKGLTCGE